MHAQAILTALGELIMIPPSRRSIRSRTQRCITRNQIEPLHCRWNRWAAWILPMFGAVELLGDKLPIPSQDGIRFGDAGDLCEHLAAQSLPNLGEGGALRIAQPQLGRKVSSQNAILRRRDIRSATTDPGSTNLSRTPAISATFCSSSKLPILLWRLIVPVF